MADELEELLDEVQRRFCRVPERAAAGGGQNGDEERAAAGGGSARTLTGAGSSEEDIDDIIDEICDDSSFARAPLRLKSNSPSGTPGSKSAVVQAHKKRCCPVFLGGSCSPNGIGTNISKRTCDQLRCTACDFRVLLFNDYIWDQSCDYLFFRNNMPELSKLRAKMIKKKGSRAYACQCSWRSIDELTELQADQRLRWVCDSSFNSYTSKTTGSGDRQTTDQLINVQSATGRGQLIFLSTVKSPYVDCKNFINDTIKTTLRALKILEDNLYCHDQTK